MVFWLLLATLSLPGAELTIPDKALEKAIRRALEKPEGPLTEVLLEGVRKLEAVGLGIRNLRGLEFARNLNEANLARNRISSVEPLSRLSNLFYLNLIIPCSLLQGSKKTPSRTTPGPEG